MPFTFSHPAIVLPLNYLPKKWFSLTGLVIGSITPDFEYFLRMRIESNYSHTIAGIFWFDLPLGLLLAFIFHQIVRDSLLDNLPIVLKSRFFRFKKFNWINSFKRNWFAIIISILIGAVSHIFWDSFTHHNGYFVQKIPILLNSIEILGKPIYILKILQHSSTLVGGCIIALVIYRLPREFGISANVNLKFWLILIGLTFIITLIRIFSGLDIKQYGNVIATAISAGIISLILTPLILKKQTHTKKV
ncbi:DUF4184 family protein [Galbibacter sp. BG1]|uniref:DUF4184 family protein n=1 Tax=Galbibacter sp. BG1 TaxID=1170699 RepID=UPI0015C06314|nr:DUF4184 family protein [Galbibacter sp. BG1]QLE00326.1 DUF4184 family protein [Galbibacter sp. BG1]